MPGRYQLPRRPGLPLLELLQVALMLLLSWQLLAAKRANATLRGEIDRGTRSFVVGDSIPRLPLRLGDGSRVEARGFCDGKSPLLLVVSSQACRHCRVLAPEWHLLSRRHDLEVLVVETGPKATSAPPAGRWHAATAESGALVEALRIREVPTVLLGGPDCRIRAAGTGLTASRAVLALARNQPAPGQAVVQTFAP